MYSQEELKNSPEYYSENIGNQLFRDISDYLTTNNLSPTDLSKQSNVPLCTLVKCYRGEIDEVKMIDYIKIKLAINSKIIL